MTTDASKEGYRGHMNNLSFQGRWLAKKDKNTHINILELGTVWMACQRFEESLRGKTISFQIDNATAVAYLLKEGGTHCRTLNAVVRKILLNCHENGIMVCPKFLRGVANLWADALFRGKKAQGWSLGNSLFKCWGTPVVDLFASSQAHKVPQYLSLDLSDKRASEGDALKERWPEGLRCAFPSPNIIQMALGRLVRWKRDLIMITPFWLDQSWFPEIICLAVELPRMF